MSNIPSGKTPIHHEDLTVPEVPLTNLGDRGGIRVDLGERGGVRTVPVSVATSSQDPQQNTENSQAD